MPAQLLATKFFIPPLNAHRVSRLRLIQRLGESLNRKLTLVSAPAGFGKTILIGEWAQRALQAGNGDRPVEIAWVSLDEGDSDPSRFWGYVLAAIARLPGLSGALSEIVTLQETSPPAAVEPVLTALINALAVRPSPPDFALVLDDYHLITTPVIHDALTFLLDHLPPRMHVLIASRADPPLALARLRVRDQLLELRAHDLRFTPDEAAAFLNDVMRLNLSSSDVADLEERAEGWIAGLQLAALSLQGHDSPSTLIQAFNGQHHFVLEYLVEDVVRRQPEHIRCFLERTSILDRLYGPLCEAVSGQPDGASLLAQLWHNNLFTEPLDEAGQWFRQHHLLAEVLFDQLQHTQPEIIPDLHRRARDWYAEHGYLHEAMRHALAGGQFEWVADCLERGYRPFVFRGELATLRIWLEALPNEIVRARPKLSIIYAWGSAYTGRLGDIEGYLRQAEDAAANLPPAEQQALHGEVVSLRAVVQSVGGDAQRAVELAHKALALAPKDDAFLQMVAQHALGNSYRLLGRAIEAESALLEAQRLCQPLGGLVLDTAVQIRLGQAQVMRGRLRQAMHSFEAALKPGRASELLPNVCEVYVRMGDVYREWNDLDTALQHVQRGVDMAQRAGNALALLNGYFTLMRVQFARGETTAPHETLSRAEQVASRYDYPHTAERLAAHQTWLNLALGDFDAAARWADAYTAARSRLDGRSGQMADLQDTLLARIRLRQGRVDEAEKLLAEILREAEAAGRGWTALQVRLLRSLTLQARGQTAQATETFERALALAEPEGYVRLFVDEGEPIRLLLQRMKDEPPLRGGRCGRVKVKTYVHTLIAACGETQPLHPSSLTIHPLIEPLSARELEVLRLLAEGRSNQAIAGALFISVGTVKSHTNHILGKLNANNRTEAVAHARTLELL